MKIRLTIALLIISLTSTAQEKLSASLFHSTFEQQAFANADPLQIMLAADPVVDTTKYNEYLADFQAHLEKLHKKTDKLHPKMVLQSVFYYSHRKKLSWYNNEVLFSDLFESGKYDCLTGTAFYAAILREMDIPHQIYEFNYHVFLIAQFEDSRVLIEPTDAINGFITDEKEIAAQIERFSQLEGITDNLEAVSKEISFKDLAGLQYYNMGIDLFNQGDYKEAYTNIEKANYLYPSKRIKEMQRIFKTQAMLVTSN